MKDDFGYFGSGLEGYVHYLETFNQNLTRTSAPGSVENDRDPETENNCDCPCSDDSKSYRSDNEASDCDDF